MNKCVRVSLVDEQPVVLAGLKSIIESRNGFEVVSLGSKAQDIVDFATRMFPHIILADISLPGHVIEAIERASEINPTAKVVVFTAVNDADLATSALQAGIKGYILKNSSSDELWAALKQVLNGQTYIAPSIAVTVASNLRGPGQSSRANVTFSPREKEVLQYLLRGQTNKEIATVLDISEKTVKQYMTVIIQKLNVRNRVEVVLAAQELFKSQSPAQLSRYS